jgi:hypothetical protein
MTRIHLKATSQSELAFTLRRVTSTVIGDTILVLLMLAALIL